MISFNNMHRIGSETVSKMRVECRDLNRPNPVMIVVTDDRKVGMTTMDKVVGHLRESDCTGILSAENAGVNFKGFVPEFVLSDRLDEDELELQVQKFYAHLR